MLFGKKKLGRPRLRENMYRRGYMKGYRRGINDGQEAMRQFYDELIYKRYKLKGEQDES